MATLIPNDFSSYNLTEEEAIQGSVFTTLQKQVIQNQLSNAAIEKNNLELDTNNPLQFAQQEASLAGQIAAFRFLLDTSAVAEEELNRALINLDTED